jgi:hypothetical protein
VEQALSCLATGSPEHFGANCSPFIERYKPEELMVTGMIHDHAARLHPLLRQRLCPDIAQASRGRVTVSPNTNSQVEAAISCAFASTSA